MLTRQKISTGWPSGIKGRGLSHLNALTFADEQPLDSSALFEHLAYVDGLFGHPRRDLRLPPPQLNRVTS